MILLREIRKTVSALLTHFTEAESSPVEISSEG